MTKSIKKKILLIEDEPTIQTLLKFILSKEFDVQVASNGYEGFLYLENREIPDLIILDWVMPYMDGKSFLKCIKVSGLYCEIPVIVLSSLKELKEELSVLPYSVSKSFSKPFNPVELKESIIKILSVQYGIAN
jgi:Response regulators consisting of a CheY-like receiver domain and a winged-helix DNA-binding domain